MKEGLFFLFLFNFIPISAQYCCTEIGKVLHPQIRNYAPNMIQKRK